MRSLISAVRGPVSALAVSLSLLVSPFTQATDAQAEMAVQPVPKATADKIIKRVEELIGPGYKIASVFKTPVFGGLYELRVGDNLLYTDEAVTYVLSGNVFDGKTFDNLTEERISKLTAVPFAELPLDLAFKTVNGKGSRKLAVFEDPNCGYCKRFRKTLSEVDDVTLYTFVVPLLGPDSLAKTKALYCAPDKAKVWDDWMLRGKALPTDGSCKDANVEKLIALRTKLNVSGTPTVFFADGSRLAGAAPKEQIEQRLAAAAKVASR
jgi:thiol:disulfide interchange protein DsbC